MSDLPPAARRRLALRLDAQLLRAPIATGTEEVLDRILAVQAQDARGARLAVRSRSTAASSADVDDALTHRRSAVVSWLNRGTLHLVAARDYWWLRSLTTPQVLPGVNRRLRQLGVSDRDVDRAVSLISEAVDSDGPRTRADVRVLLDRAGVPTEGQTLVHLLAAASLRGHIVRGPLRGGDHAFVGVEAWLGPAPEPLDERDALAELAHRYLAGHGPARADDLAKWAGITLGRARTGVAALSEVCVEDADGFVTLADDVSRGDRRRRQPAMPPPRLLGAFDPVLHGWVDRSVVAGDHRDVVTTNGVFRPCALVGGRVAGTWRLSDARLRLRLLEPVTPAVSRALSHEADAVAAFLGLPGVSVVSE
jgi:hypothetical protein